MSLSDCIKCWDTPCTCGWEYRDWSLDYRLKHASVVLGIDLNILTKLLKDNVPVNHPLKRDRKKLMENTCLLN